MSSIQPAANPLAFSFQNIKARAHHNAFSGALPVVQFSGVAALGNQAGLSAHKVVYLTNSQHSFKIDGGLSMVSRDIPRELNAKGIDTVTIMPFYSGMDQKGFADTGVKFSLPDPVHPDQTTDFSLWQAQADGTRIVAIRNDRYFTPLENIYFDAYQLYNDASGQAPWAALDDPAKAALLSNDEKRMLQRQKQQTEFIKNRGLLSPKVQVTALLNQAMVKTMTQLQQPPAGSTLDPFQSNVMIANDWMMGMSLAALQQQAPELFAKHDKIFFVHNHYDTAVPGIKTSDALETQGFASLERQRLATALGVPANQLAAKSEDPVSFWSTGVRLADRVIIDANYLQSLLSEHVATPYPTVQLPALQEKARANRVHPMHHGVDFAVNGAYDSKVLAKYQADGFTQLSKTADLASDLVRFKTANKAALQKRLGLTVDPNATLLAAVTRIDPVQKGVLQYLEPLKTLLKENPKLQFVFACGELPNNQAIKAMIAPFLSEFPGQVSVLQTFNPDNPALIYAGSDFTLIPSNYEPYGLTQLEAMAMGSIPIATPVDGLKSTLVDDKTAILAQPYGERATYMRAAGKILSNMTTFETFDQYLDNLKKRAVVPEEAEAGLKAEFERNQLTETERQAIERANQAYRGALQRALTLTSHAKDEMRQNGVKAAHTQHAWPAIIEQYYQPMLNTIASAAAEPPQPVSIRPAAGDDADEPSKGGCMGAPGRLLARIKGLFSGEKSAA